MVSRLHTEIFQTIGEKTSQPQKQRKKLCGFEVWLVSCYFCRISQIIYCNSQSAIYLNKNQMYPNGNKHIDVSMHIDIFLTIGGKI